MLRFAGYDPTEQSRPYRPLAAEECLNGHVLDEANTYLLPIKRRGRIYVSRRCRKCQNAYNGQWRRDKRRRLKA